MIHQDHLDQYKGPNILYITHIQAEEVITIQKQRHFMDQFTNLV